MALEVQQGTIAISTLTDAATHTINLSGFSAAPKVMIFWAIGDRALDAVGAADHDRSIGWATGAANQRCLTTVSSDGSTAARADRRSSNAGIYAAITHAASAADSGIVAVQSANSSQVVLVNAGALDHAVRIGYLILGGSDITGAVIGELTQPTSTGTQNITGLGIDPSCVLFAHVRRTALGRSADSMFSLGVGLGASGSVQQVACAMGSNDAAADAQAIRYMYDGECIAVLNDAVTEIRARASFAGVVSGGFDLTWNEASVDADLVLYLAIAGTFQVGLGSFTTPTSVTTATGSTLGFTPAAILAFSHCFAKSTQDTVQDNDALSIGAATGAAARHAMAMHDADAAATMAVTTGAESDGIYLRVAGGAVAGRADINSWADPLVFDQEDADPDAAYVAYLAFAAAAGGGGAVALDGTSAATSATAATLAVARPVTGTAVAVSGSAAALRATRPVTGTAAALSGAAGTAVVARGLAATAVAVSAATGELDTGGEITLDGAATATSAAAGVLRVARPLAGSAVALSLATGGVGVARGATGVAPAVSSLNGGLVVQRPLAGTSVATSTGAGELLTEEPEPSQTAAAAARTFTRSAAARPRTWTAPRRDA